MFKLAKTKDTDSKLIQMAIASAGGVGGMLVGNTAAVNYYQNNDLKREATPVTQDTINKLKKHMVKNPDSITYVKASQSGYVDKDMHTPAEKATVYEQVFGKNHDKKLLDKHILLYQDDLYGLAHELGHASNWEKLSNPMKRLLYTSRMASGMSPKTMLPAAMLYGIAGSEIADKDHSPLTRSAIAAAAVTPVLPTLIDEGLASYKGMKHLKEVFNISRRSSFKSLLPAFLTYAAIPGGALAAGAAYKKLAE